MKTNQKLAGEILNDNSTIPIDENYIIPRQTIHNWIKKWKIPMIKYEPISFKGDTLYVMADEKWIHEQIKTMMKQKRKNIILCQRLLFVLQELKTLKKSEN